MSANEQHPIKFHPIIIDANWLCFEVLVILILALITIFRKRLSSNDEYRHGDDFFEVCQRAEVIAARVAAGKKNSNGFPERLSLDNESTKKLPLNKDLTITHFSQEVLLHVVVYLTTSEVGSLSVVCRSLNRDARTDYIWEQLWRHTFGRMWRHKEIVEIRKLRGITWDPYRLNQSSKSRRPSQGWMLFYLQFEFCWTDWLLAGCCTSECCMIGLHGSIYNLTNFLGEHPGSPETMMDSAGGDGTDVFSDIGHSSFATVLADMFLVWGRDDACRVDSPYLTKMRGSNKAVSRIVQTRPPTLFQVRMKRDRFFAERRVLQDGGQVWALTVADTSSSPSSAVADVHTRSAVVDDNGNDDDDNNEALSRMMLDVASTRTSTSSVRGASGTSSVRGAITISTVAGGLISMSAMEFLHNIEGLAMSTVMSIAEGIVTAGSSAAPGLFCLVTGSTTAGNGTASTSNTYFSSTANGSRLRLSASSGSSSSSGRFRTKKRKNGPARVRNMAPSLHLTTTSSSVCSVGAKHYGRPRMLFDPLERKWWCWWTCCGVGELASDEDDGDFDDVTSTKTSSYVAGDNRSSSNVLTSSEKAMDDAVADADVVITDTADMAVVSLSAK